MQCFQSHDFLSHVSGINTNACVSEPRKPVFRQLLFSSACSFQEASKFPREGREEISFFLAYSEILIRRYEQYARARLGDRVHQRESGASQRCVQYVIEEPVMQVAVENHARIPFGVEH